MKDNSHCFKVGDRVVFTNSYDISESHKWYTFDNLENQAGTIVFVGDGDSVQWQLDSNGEKWWSDNEQLILEKNYIVASILRDL